MAKPTATFPMTTLFTQPTDCSTSYTYEASEYNDVSNGILMQNLFEPAPSQTCYPSYWTGAGRDPGTFQVYSPGACPSGWSTGPQTINSASTTAVCCPPGKRYLTGSMPINADYTYLQYVEGCVATFNGTTTVPARLDGSDSALDSTTLSGVITEWVQPITVEYQQKDLTLFYPPSSTSTIPSATSTPSPSSPPVHSSSGLSVRAKVGIIVAVVLVVCGALAGLVFFIISRRRSRQRQGQTLYDAVPTGGRPEGPGPERTELPDTSNSAKEAPDTGIHEIGAHGDHEPVASSKRFNGSKGVKRKPVNHGSDLIELES